MSNITAAEFRIAEKVARSLGFVTAQSYADHAARLESVGVTLDAQLAQTLRQVASPSFADRADYWGTLSAAALEFLTSTGRLIPAGGMALTAEQVGWVQALSQADPWWDEEQLTEVQAHVRALFPAAEPAEEETKAERDSQGIIRINGGRIVALSRDPRELVQQWYDLAEPGSKWQRDYAAALDLFDREAASSPVVPAPTEDDTACVPARVDTSVIGVAAAALSAALDVLDPHESGAWEHTWRTLGDLRDCAERERSAPAPTETGPWQDWPSLDAIPADVRTVWDKSGDEYRRRKNGGWKFRYRGGEWKKITLPLADFDNYAPFTTAPFVAAEEG